MIEYLGHFYQIIVLISLCNNVRRWQFVPAFLLRAWQANASTYLDNEIGYAEAGVEFCALFQQLLSNIVQDLWSFNKDSIMKSKNGFGNRVKVKRLPYFYQDDTGYLKGYHRTDGYFWLEEVRINPDFRGKGLARSLLSHLPKRTKLLAVPMQGSGPTLSAPTLIRLYKSLGFTCQPDINGNPIMSRG